MKFVVFLAAAILALASAVYAQGRPVIDGLSIVGPNTYAPGQAIRVQLTGTPHGRASCRIVGIDTPIPMEETAPGSYLGKLIVPATMHVDNAPVSATLTVQGATVAYRSRDTVSVVGNAEAALGPPSSPTAMYLMVNPPGNFDRDFALSGQTLADALIVARVTVTSWTNDATVHETLTFGGVADETGYFTIPIHLPPGVMAGDVGIDVVATDVASSGTRRVQFDIATGE